MLAFTAVTARAVDVAFTANLQNYTSSPAQAYLDAQIVDCGVDAQGRPNTPLTATAVKTLVPQVLPTASDGTVSTTITPNSDITCGNVLDTTHYAIEVRIKAGAYPNPATDKLLSRNIVHIGPGDFTFNAGASMLTPGAPPTGVDYTGYLVTRPMRALLFANFPTSCAAHKDRLQRLDPATPGQVDYVCNAAGNGWDLVGDGGSGGGGSFTFSVNGSTITGGSGGSALFSVNGVTL